MQQIGKTIIKQVFLVIIVFITTNVDSQGQSKWIKKNFKTENKASYWGIRTTYNLLSLKILERNSGSWEVIYTYNPSICGGVNDYNINPLKEIDNYSGQRIKLEAVFGMQEYNDRSVGPNCITEEEKEYSFELGPKINVSWEINEKELCDGNQAYIALNEEYDPYITDNRGYFDVDANYSLASNCDNRLEVYSKMESGDMLVNANSSKPIGIATVNANVSGYSSNLIEGNASTSFDITVYPSIPDGNYTIDGNSNVREFDKYVDYFANGSLQGYASRFSWEIDDPEAVNAKNTTGEDYNNFAINYKLENSEVNVFLYRENKCFSKRGSIPYN